MRKTVLEFSNLYIKNDDQEQLDDLNVDFFPGEIYLLSGTDNTPRVFGNIFGGHSKILKGNILLNGNRVDDCTKTIFEANQIYFVGEVEFIDDFTVAENMFLLKRNNLRKVRINKNAMRISANNLLQNYDMTFRADDKTVNLRDIEKVWLQMIRLIDGGAKMLVVAGQSHICNEQDMRRHLQLLKKLKECGVCLLISDSHPEYFLNLADQLYFMKKGKIIKKYTDKSEFCRCYNQRNDVPKKQMEHSQIYSETKQRFIWKNKNGKDMTLDFRKGEIVYIQAATWELQWEICEKLLGENGNTTSLEYDGIKWSCRNRSYLARKRIAFWGTVPLNKEYFYNLSIRDNVLMPSIRKISHFGFYQRQARFIFNDKDFCTELNEIEKNGKLIEENLLKIMWCRWKIFNPKILIIHNILSRADCNMREWLKSAFVEMTKRGTALIFLEMFEEDVSQIADKVVIANKEWI